MCPTLKQRVLKIFLGPGQNIEFSKVEPCRFIEELRIQIALHGRKQIDHSMEGSTQTMQWARSQIGLYLSTIESDCLRALQAVGLVASHPVLTNPPYSWTIAP